MKDYKRSTKWSELRTLHVFDINGKEIPLCDVSPIDTDNLAGKLADLEDKIESGEIDYVADKDKQITSLTAENDNLTVELEVAQRDVENLTRTLQEANDEIKALEAENEELRETLSKMETVEKELRERLDKAVEIPNVFNKDIVAILYDKYYDKYKIPNLYNAKVVGIGVDTYALYEGKIDIIMAALCENGDVHFLHGRQYKKKWFLREDRSEAEARLAELKGGRE